MKNKNSIPKHIAIIMDGNRRWARENKMEAFKGHEYVANKVIENLTDACIEKQIPYLTLWAFSTENWNRDAKEVDGLMHLFRESFKKNASLLHDKNVRLNVIGDVSRFPDDIQESISHWLEISQNNTAITVTFALNYGGRDELLRAIKNLVTDIAPKFLPSESVSPDVHNIEITEELFESYLDTNNMPDPDLIIRPGGEKRLSGYLPWQSVYSELYFTDILMPDFDAEQLQIALDDYAMRQRRFGK